MADEELKKAFMELKNKNLETAARIKAVDNQIDQLKNKGKHAELTQGEIRQCGDDTRVFESIGRMFVLESSETIMGQLSDRVQLSKDTIIKLDAQKSYLNKSLRESENSLRELVERKKA